MTFIPPTPLAYLIQALVAKGESEQAETELQASGMTGDLPDMFLFNILLYARGWLRIARYRVPLFVAGRAHVARAVANAATTLRAWRAFSRGSQPLR